ncbi:MAG TPA: hypothetical protein VFC02_10555 [Anaerolineales bacterium]|nr:hypothetical protein [Anaerolineales bacterium]
MSTISQAPKVNTARTFNNRNLNLLIVATLAITLVVIFASVPNAPVAKPTDHSAYILYRQGEWLSVPISNQAAYQIFRRGEVASPVSNEEAYQMFRKGEVMSVPNLTNAEAYHLFRLGEWASVSIPAVDISAYQLSERTLTDPKAGLTMFHLSERTLVPAPFTQFQLSEWFGQ